MHLVRRSRLAVGLFGGVILGLSACLGPSETADDPEAFDPPSSFDLARSVPLTEDETRQGTLHDTTLFSVADGVLHATDLYHGTQLWSAELPADSEQDYLRPPLVLDGTVVVATGEQLEDSASENNYVVNIFGIDGSTGGTLWHKAIPICTLSSPNFGLELAERDGDLLVTIGSLAAPFTTLRLDADTGNLQWQADVLLVAMATGPYAVAASAAGHSYDPEDAVALDLQTGQVGAPLVESGSPRIVPYVDAYGDESYVTFSMAGEGSSHAFLRFSSVDATVQPFAPADDDIRYTPDSSCTLEAGQRVVLCLAGPFGSAYGVDATSGQVVWMFDGPQGKRLEAATQFHGHVYGRLGDQYAVVSLDSGEVVEPSIDMYPTTVSYTIGLSVPTMVNEYGAIGVPRDRDLVAGTLYVWAPASG